MVYVTGDMHGDISRFRSKSMRKLRKNDYLIVCGDFGFLWDGSAKEQRILKWIGKRRYHVLFIEGVHDNVTLLSGYDRVPWNGGEVHEISGKLKHLCRGGVFNIDGQRIFVFGGGECDGGDAWARGMGWWREQLPNRLEITAAVGNLTDVQNTVDYIITHQCSHRLKKLITMRDSETNIMDAFFDAIRASCKYKGWFFGSFHVDKAIPPNEVALFRRVWPLNDRFSISQSRGGNARGKM